MGIASGVPVTYISVGHQHQDGDLDGFLDIINFLLSQPNPPQVFSTSYGFSEDMVTPSSAKYVISIHPSSIVKRLTKHSRLCIAYAQLGARGTSILFASGDGGVSGIQTSICTSFVPTFPSSCPL